MIYCPRCRNTMEYQHTQSLTIPGGNGQSVLHTCSPCRVRCIIDTKLYFDADFDQGKKDA